MWLTNLITALILIFLGFLIKKYKLAKLISGYNTLSKKEQEKYDTNQLTKVVGNMLMVASLFLLTPLIFYFFDNNVSIKIFIGSWLAFSLYIIISLININLNEEMIKK